MLSDPGVSDASLDIPVCVWQKITAFCRRAGQGIGGGMHLEPGGLGLASDFATHFLSDSDALPCPLWASASSTAKRGK